MVKTTWYIYLYINIYIHDSYGKLVGTYTVRPTNPVGQIPFFSPKFAACRGPPVSNKWCTTLGHDQHLWPKISGVWCVCFFVVFMATTNNQGFTLENCFFMANFKYISMYYCWWFRNPAPPGTYKNPVSNGTNYLLVSINWCCAGIQPNQQLFTDP